MNDHYGDFNRPSNSFPSTQKTDSLAKKSAELTVNTSKTVSSKTAEVSQPILADAKLQTPTPLTDLHVAPLSKRLSDGTSTSEAKADAVGTDILAPLNAPTQSGSLSQTLLHTDIQRMNSIHENSPSSKESRFNLMNEQELTAALEDVDNSLEDIEKIVARLEEISSKNTDDLSNKSENISNKTENILNKTENILNETENISNTTEDISNTTETLSNTPEIHARIFQEEGHFILNKDGTIRPITLKESQSGNYDKAFLIKFKNGILKSTQENGRLFKVGDKINREEIKEIQILTEQQLEEELKATLAMMTNSTVVEKKERHQAFNPPVNSEEGEMKKTQQNGHAYINGERFLSSGTQANFGPSTKELNQKRLESFFEAMEKKFEKLKLDIQQEEIKRDDLSHSLIKSHISQSELKTESRKVTSQYKSLMAQLRDPSSPIEIPLATIAKFEKFEVVLEGTSTPILNQSIQGNPGAIEETIALKREVINFITSMIKTSGSDVRVSSNPGKSSQGG